MNKHIFRGIMASAVIIGITALFAGCGDEEDTWSNVTSLDQINGTWKGSYSQTQEDGGIRVTISVDMTMTINASAKTSTMSMTTKMTFSGGTIDSVWETIKSGTDINLEGGGVTVDNTNHSITITTNQSADSLTDDAVTGFQINQEGTKIKMPLVIPDSPSSSEIIMTKQ